MEKILENIYKVSENENYWLFRAGKEAVHFDHFYYNKKIGMAWDKIDSLDQMIDNDVLKEIVRVKYPEEEKPGNISSKIHQFKNIMKKGDIVIMPDEKKVQVAFGRIADDEVIVNKAIVQLQLIQLEVGKKDNGIDPGMLNKFRKVEWIKILQKDELSSKLLLHLFSPHTISKLSKEVKYEVNKLIFDKFIIGDKVYLKYKIDTQNDILASDVRIFFDLIDYAEQMINIFDDNQKITTKLNASSPGEFVAAMGLSSFALIILGYIFSGGNLQFKDKDNNREFKWGNGKTILDYLEQRHRHKMEWKKLEIEQKEKLLKIENDMINNVSVEKLIEMKKNLDMKIPKDD